MKSELELLILRKFGTISNFARELGRKPQTVSAALKRKTWRLSTMRKWAEKLELTPADFDKYFF